MERWYYCTCCSSVLRDSFSIQYTSLALAAAAYTSAYVVGSSALVARCGCFAGCCLLCLLGLVGSVCGGFFGDYTMESILKWNQRLQTKSYAQLKKQNWTKLKKRVPLRTKKQCMAGNHSALSAALLSNFAFFECIFHQGLSDWIIGAVKWSAVRQTKLQREYNKILIRD